MTFEDDDNLIEFFINRESCKITQDKYIHHLKLYSKIAGDNLTPTQLVDEAKKEYEQGIHPSKTENQKAITSI